MTNKKQCGICANCVPQINGGSGFNNCEEANAVQMVKDREMSNKLTNIQLAVKCEMERYRDLEKSGLKNAYPSRILFEAINRELAELQELRRNYLALRGEIEDVRSQLYEAENQANEYASELQEFRNSYQWRKGVPDDE